MNRTAISLGALTALFASCGTTTDDVAPPTTTAATPPAAERLEPYECGNVQRIHTLGGVFLASQPQPVDFEHAQKGGIKTVVNLRHDSELEFDERAVVEGLGMRYEHLPWNGADELTDAVFDRARELLRTAERPLMLHCASANRVGALWLAFRALDGGLDLDAATAEARMVGLKTPAYLAKATDYVNRRRA
jgi:uncharacterized protein (TIGR01244 family)